MALTLLQVAQLISAIPVFLAGMDYLATLLFSGNVSTSPNKTSTSPLLIIMAFRDEESTLPQSLPPILEYSKTNNESRIILVDSKSTDNSRAEILDLISHQGKFNQEPRILTSSGGKCAALNLAMDSRKYGEQVLIVDSDVIVSTSGIEILREILMDDSIGSASGLEIIEQNSTRFSKSYKSRINKVRSLKSTSESSIVLEGSMLMFDPDRIGWVRFDERINADDAQISVHSIFSGHRSIVCARAKFKQIPNSKLFSLGQSVRRGQGLTSVLTRNPRLFGVRGMFRETLRNWLIYIFVPWSLASLTLLAIYSIFYVHEEGIKWTVEYLNLAFIIAVLALPFGRALLLGSFSMIIAHLRILSGKSYSSWRPIR